MKTNLGPIQGADIDLFTDLTGKEIVKFVADMDVDCDGTGGNPHHDPCFQPDTRLHFQGKALCAEQVRYVVVPPVVLQRTRGMVLGAMCRCRNQRNGRRATAVVGDSGPARKVGEGSPALCEALGLDPNPNHGGTSDFIIEYEIEVGVPAVVDGITYALQNS